MTSLLRDQGLLVEYGGVTSGTKKSSRKHCKTRTPGTCFSSSNFWEKEIPPTLLLDRDSNALKISYS
ncbi:hypothetical protein CapIbe_019385 [Capra ibex]